MALSDYYDTIFLGISVPTVVMILLLLFFSTSLGQAYIATDGNEGMVYSVGIQTDHIKILELVLSNGSIGLSGALITQSDGYTDVSKGAGVTVVSLASLITGEILFGELMFGKRPMAIAVGSVIYQPLILLVIKLGSDATYLKIFSAVILAICLMIPQLRKALQLHGSSNRRETK